MTSPSTLLTALAEHDQRMCCAYDLYTEQFIYRNAAFNSFFAALGNDITLKGLFASVHPDDQGYLADRYRLMKPGVLTGNIDFRFYLPGDKEFSLRLSMFFNDVPDERHIFTAYLEDISAFKAHSDKLNEFANKKNAVLNILTHDLAGPLGSVGNLAQLLARETKAMENPEINKWISMLERISRNGVQLIQDFMQQEFIESAGVALVKKRTDLALIFERAIREYQQAQDSLTRTFSFKSNQPVIFAEIDESKFFQVINNLISNAIKFTDAGSSISLTLEERAKMVLLTLTDNGIGIPERFHATLFDKFSPAGRTGLHGEPSVGLGMSIIKTIVEWHDGRIWFESQENKGTSFYIEIAKSS